ncbi:hypothetical protein B1812_10780 [Methylocystis bryophila]|uniref:Uncharacterized protein n=2 Tax=Methylocystis bryophila TaxID=655015 RepID=A0A1W6N147_9HYPH|nr:hypothetical protein B1812_10780 [Methylocystis bryophila]
MASVSALDKWIVSALWIVAIVLVAAPGDERLSSRALPASSRPRLTHRVLGVAITIFVLAHVANHLFGLVGPSAYMGVMKALRHVYRFPFLEPALPLIFLSTAASGGFLAWRASARRMDGLRAFQLASGIYLFFYIVSHLNAVFVLARSYLKIDSDWDFATGAPMGLIQDPWSARLIPHYAWAVFFALGHVFAAIRTNLLARGASRAWADGMLFWGSASGALITLLILLGMCGLRLSLV